MIISMDKTIGTICHICGHTATSDISPFHIMDSFELNCNICGAKVIHVKKEKAQKSYTLHQKCFLCGETHVSKISHKAMWSKKLFSFGCDASLYDMCYVGQETKVKESLCELMDTLNEIVEKDADKKAQPSSELLFKPGPASEIFALLQTFLATGKIRCTCNDNRFIVRMAEDGIEVCCGSCESFCKIKCKTDEDVENFKKTDILLLRKD